MELQTPAIDISAIAANWESSRIELHTPRSMAQSPNTATPSKTIWSLVSKQAFYTDAATLRRLSEVPVNAIEYKKRQLPPGPKEDEYVFKFEEEKQIVDDISFICAYVEGFDTVTAATLLATRSTDGVQITLAANDGVHAVVQTTMRQIARILEKCATGSWSSLVPFMVSDTDLVIALQQSEGQDEVFDLIFTLNRNRILGRIESPKYVPLRRNRGQESQGLPLRIESILNANMSRQSKTMQTDFLLQSQLDGFKVRLAEFESCTSTERADKLLKSILRLVCDMAGEVGFSKRMENLGIPEASDHWKHVLQIDKVASYWRISRELVKYSRRYRKYFRLVEMIFLTHLRPSSSPIGLKNPRNVHAEVQMIVHYEFNALQLRPRVIGASKKACFLCDTFIRKHGWFEVSKAHRQLYRRWTVPDLEQYTKATRNRLCSTLAAVHVELKTTLANQNGRRKYYPLQSSVNVNRPLLGTPSTFTLLSVASGSKEDIQAMNTSRDSRMTECTVVDDLSNIELDEQLSGQVPYSPQETHFCSPSLAADFLLQSSDLLCFGWIDIFLSQAGSNDCSSEFRTAETGHIKAVECGDPENSDNNIPKVDLLHLPLDADVSVDTALMAPSTFAIRLTAAGRKSITISCEQEPLKETKLLSF